MKSGALSYLELELNFSLKKSKKLSLLSHPIPSNFSLQIWLYFFFWGEGNVSVCVCVWVCVCVCVWVMCMWERDWWNGGLVFVHTFLLVLHSDILVASCSTQLHLVQTGLFLHCQMNNKVNEENIFFFLLLLPCAHSLLLITFYTLVLW